MLVTAPSSGNLSDVTLLLVLNICAKCHGQRIEIEEVMRKRLFLTTNLEKYE